MEQITIRLNDMEDVKREIDNCQRKAVTSVVELGYILRKADDAELFREAGYSSIFKFAEAEYGWNQSQTSRFMDINREFSEGGYSTVLQERYMGYGQAKLSEMLTLPDNIREELNPDMKREDIREVKREMKEAAEVEKEVNFAAKVTLESTDNNFLTDSIEFLMGSKEFETRMESLWPYIKTAAVGGKVDIESVAVSVSGTGFGFTRAGAYMYFFKNEDIRITKGPEKKSYGYDDFVQAAAALKNPSGMTLEEWYEEVFGRQLPKEEPPEEKPEKKNQKKPEKKKEVKKPVAEREMVNESKEKEEPECEGQAELSSFAEKEKIEYEKEDEKNETSLTENDLDGSGNKSEGTVATAHQEPETDVLESGGCDVCSGRIPMTSNDGEFRISVKRSGLARIERGIYHAILELNYCPRCGEELGK